MSKPISFFRDMPIMDKNNENIVLFHPHIPESAIREVENTLRSRWVGQGPKVDLFEKMFSEKFANFRPSVAVGSGTDALHLSYILADIQEDDEVITPVFTCTATNIPLLYQRAKIKFADIQKNTLNIDPQHVRELINEKTKAIVCVHYGGLPCDMKELSEIAEKFNIPIVEDAAQALGASYQGKSIGSISDFTTFSFQAIKHITTGDGGLLTINDASLEEKAKRLRWFGIDRSAKQKGIWENDIKEIGYKYQMTDIGASIAIASLKEFDSILNFRKQLYSEYCKGLKNIDGIIVIGDGYTDRENSAWSCTILVENRWDFQKKLRENKIESNQVHYRNDRYTIFGGKRQDLPNMNELEDSYLVLPLHTKMNIEDVAKICDVVRSGW